MERLLGLLSELSTASLLVLVLVSNGDVSVTTPALMMLTTVTFPLSYEFLALRDW
eukprot:m.22363 g.22363  ORF g.22363 m.22363 type:complete len:55 (+) comp11239_c0_seq1:1081-1245(+)